MNQFHRIFPGITLFLVGLVSAQPELSAFAGLDYSTAYGVKLDGTAKTVFESRAAFQKRAGTVESGNGIQRMSFCNFDLPASGTASVEIRLPGSAEGYEIRPLSTAVRPILAGNTLTLSLSAPVKLVLKKKNSWDDVLCLFANPAHTPPLRNSVTHFFDASKVHDYHATRGEGIDRNDAGKDIQNRSEVAPIVLKDGETVYLAENAVVRTRFEVAPGASVRIFGRGVLAYALGHVEDFGVVAANLGPGKVEISGITVCDAPGWILRVFGGRGHRIENVKMVGNWHFNTDGVQFGADSGRIADCFLQCNDDNFSFSGAGKGIQVRNNVLWNLYNGGVFNFGWGNPRYSDFLAEDNVVLRAGDCCDGTPEVERRKAPITMISHGQEQMERITFRNLDIEEIVGRGQWIHFLATQPGPGFVRDMVLEGVQVRRADTVWGLMKGATGKISRVTFSGLRIRDIPVVSAVQGGLQLVNAQDLRFLPGSVAVRPLAPAFRQARPHSATFWRKAWLDALGRTRLPSETDK